MESGWINHEYYFVDIEGNKIKVNSENFSPDKKVNTPSISLSGTGVMSGNTLDKSSDIHHTDFIINKKDSMTTNNDFKETEKFESLTRALVEKCRKL